jgi:hypothetical protein
MSAQLAVVREPLAPAIMEQVVVVGDLTNMNAAQRVAYYKSVCESLGLNPLTKPFDYLYLNKKLILYARKDATEQLRRLYGVSITRLDTVVAEGVYIATAYAQTADGRVDSDIGAVSIQGLTGEAKSNAMMKAITKAKRRVTLSVCGLGWLDETEVDSIPGAQPSVVNIETGEVVEGQVTELAAEPDYDAEYARLCRKAKDALGLEVKDKDGHPMPDALPAAWSAKVKARAVEYVRGVVEQAEAATKAA